MAAPALAASIADCAICAGVTGTAGFLPGVSAEPVTAQAIITFRCMVPPAGACPASLAQVLGASPGAVDNRFCAKDMRQCMVHRAANGRVRRMPAAQDEA